MFDVKTTLDNNAFNTYTMAIEPLELLIEEFNTVERKATICSSLVWYMSNRLAFWQAQRLRIDHPNDPKYSVFTPDQRAAEHLRLESIMDEDAEIIAWLVAQADDNLLPSGDQIAKRFDGSAEQTVDIEMSDDVIDAISSFHDVDVKEVREMMALRKAQRQAENAAMIEATKNDTASIARVVDNAVAGSVTNVEIDWVRGRTLYGLIRKATLKAEDWGSRALQRAIEERMMRRQLSLIAESKLYKPIATKGHDLLDKIDEALDTASRAPMQGAEKTTIDEMVG